MKWVKKKGGERESDRKFRMGGKMRTNKKLTVSSDD